MPSLHQDLRLHPHSDRRPATSALRLLLGLVTALVATSLVYVACSACALNTERQPQPMMFIAEKDNGQTVTIPLGGLLRILLPENATTGYRWTIDHFSDEFIEAVSSDPHYSGHAIGSGGEVEFIFKAKKIGSGEIVLKQWRHWEGDASILNRFRLRLNVQS